MQLWHVSEQSGIEIFVPRPPPALVPGFDQPVVWAIDGLHLPNYLVPRDCPRVAFHALPGTTQQDRDDFLGAGGASHVLAIESGWLERAARCVLWAYELPPRSFACADATAGYYVSPEAVAPVSRRRIDNPLGQLAGSGVELRVVANLRPLAALVAASSLAFSCIRMRNAGAGPDLTLGAPP